MSQPTNPHSPLAITPSSPTKPSLAKINPKTHFSSYSSASTELPGPDLPAQDTCSQSYFSVFTTGRIQGSVTDDQGSKFKSGQGKILDSSGKVKYEGSWSDGQFQGKGTFFFNDGEVYSGDWNKNTREGQGTFFYNGGEIYVSFLGIKFYWFK